MKYCPNPSCGGLEKFKTISEFNDTAMVCSDCGADLVSGPAPDTLPRDKSTPDPNLELVPILQTTREADLVIIESLLAEAEIPYLARGQQIQDLFGWGRLVGINPITGPVEFLVSAEDYADAQEVLGDWLATAESDPD